MQENSACASVDELPASSHDSCAANSSVEGTIAEQVLGQQDEQTVQRPADETTITSSDVHALPPASLQEPLVAQAQPYRQLKVEDALAYLDQVKMRFEKQEKQPWIYNQVCFFFVCV
jgi:histone deacetylase complex regulatory component SIN3